MNIVEDKQAVSAPCFRRLVHGNCNRNLCRMYTHESCYGGDVRISSTSLGPNFVVSNWMCLFPPTSLS
ncbi:hypothetical protein AB3S75_013098 [Citrus x aurantiifolia]